MNAFITTKLGVLPEFVVAELPFQIFKSFFGYELGEYPQLRSHR